MSYSTGAIKQQSGATQRFPYGGIGFQGGFGGRGINFAIESARELSYALKTRAPNEAQSGREWLK